MAPALEKERTMAGESIKLVANNKKAYHDYFIEEKYECGISLAGTEVKSIRQGKVSVKEAYVEIEGGEAWIEGMNISPYDHGNLFNRDPVRKRKLLLHKTEIRKLAQAVQQDGDKRQDIRKRDITREMERNYRDVMKY